MKFNHPAISCWQPKERMKCFIDLDINSVKLLNLKLHTVHHLSLQIEYYRHPIEAN